MNLEERSGKKEGMVKKLICKPVVKYKHVSLEGEDG